MCRFRCRRSDYGRPPPRPPPGFRRLATAVAASGCRMRVGYQLVSFPIRPLTAAQIAGTALAEPWPALASLGRDKLGAAGTCGDPGMFPIVSTSLENPTTPAAPDVQESLLSALVPVLSLQTSGNQSGISYIYSFRGLCSFPPFATTLLFDAMIRSLLRRPVSKPLTSHTDCSALSDSRPRRRRQ